MRPSVLAACVVVAAAGVASNAAATENGDVVEVTGHVFRGTVVEVRDRVLVRMRLANGDELTIPWSDVRSLRRAPESTPLGAPVPASWSPPPPQTTRWYGGQTLVVDGVAIVAAFLNLEPLAIPLYCLGGPTVHVVHGHAGKAVGSLLLRAALPVGFAAAFLAAWPSTPDSSPKGTPNNGPSDAVVGAFLGVALGVVSAIAIDAAALAREPIPATTPHDGAAANEPHAAPRPTVAPLVAPRSTGDGGHGGWIGVVGTF